LGAVFQLTYTAPAPAENIWYAESFDTHLPQLLCLPLTGQRVTIGEPATLPKQGDSVPITAALLDGNNTLDQGEIVLPWDTTQGLGLQAQQLAQPSVQGGFTETDRSTLNLVAAWTALDTFITSLVLEDLGTSSPGGQIAAALTSWRYGAIIRMTQIDPTLSPTTPDDDYWVKTLASLRLFRGTDVLLRVPIHRSSQIVSFEGDLVQLQFSAISTTLWNPGITLEVDFLERCAGQVLLMKLP